MAPRSKKNFTQTCERNRCRLEARCLIPFETTATAVDFPFVEQAARLTRCLDSDRHPAQEIQTEYLLTSRPGALLSAPQMLADDRHYWGIETGLHLRLEGVAREDCSRVRHPTSVLNLALIRRAVVSLAVHWIRKWPHKRQATLSGFYDFMRANQSKKAFSLVTVCHSSWLPKS